MVLERESGGPRGVAFVNLITPREVEVVRRAGPHQLSEKSTAL